MVRVKDLMNHHVMTLEKDAKVEEATKLLAKGSFTSVVVVDDKKPVGIINQSDVVELLAYKPRMKDKVVKIMKSPVTTFNWNASLDQATKIIDSKQFRMYPVVDDYNNLVGMVTQNAVVHAANDNIEFHRNLQNLVVVLFVIFELFILVFYKYFPVFG